MDKLIIQHLKLTTCIGTHAWEKQTPQNLYLDITLATPPLTQTETPAIDYDQITHHLLNFVKERHFYLIETLASDLAQALLIHFKTPWLQLTLRKPGGTLQAREVAIMIERTQDDIINPQ